MNLSPSPHVRRIGRTWAGERFGPVCRDCACAVTAEYQHYDALTDLVTRPLCERCYRERCAA